MLPFNFSFKYLLHNFNAKFQIFCCMSRQRPVLILAVFKTVCFGGSSWSSGLTSKIISTTWLGRSTVGNAAVNFFQGLDIPNTIMFLIEERLTYIRYQIDARDKRSRPIYYSNHSKGLWVMAIKMNLKRSSSKFFI